MLPKRGRAERTCCGVRRLCEASNIRPSSTTGEERQSQSYLSVERKARRRGACLSAGKSACCDRETCAVLRNYLDFA